MRMDFVLASNNQGKIKEMKSILKDFPYNVISMKEAGFFSDIEENGTTFQENAHIKAAAVFSVTKGFVMADDSGLVIDALDGAPGIRSARFMGEDTDYLIKNNEILRLLKDIPFEKRTARFVCAAAVFCPDGNTFMVEECMEGYIHDCIAGENGFGYDPIFYVPELHMTSAQISEAEKNKISHRGKAIASVLAKLQIS